MKHLQASSSPAAAGLQAQPFLLPLQTVPSCGEQLSLEAVRQTKPIHVTFCDLDYSFPPSPGEAWRLPAALQIPFCMCTGSAAGVPGVRAVSQVSTPT